MGVLDKLFLEFENDIKYGNILTTFQVGIALKVLEDRFDSIGEDTLAQKCNGLQHKLLNDNL